MIISQWRRAESPGNSMHSLRRIGLSLGALLFASAILSLLSNLRISFRSFSFHFSFPSAVFVFRIIMRFAFPVWLLYLPFVIAFKDAKGPRCWAILTAGALFGPALFAFWGLILQLRGADPHTIWLGNDLGFGVGRSIPFAFALGFLTAAMYVIALRRARLHR